MYHVKATHGAKNEAAFGMRSSGQRNYGRGDQGESWDTVKEKKKKANGEHRAGVCVISNKVLSKRSKNFFFFFGRQAVRTGGVHV